MYSWEISKMHESVEFYNQMSNQSIMLFLYIKSKKLPWEENEEGGRFVITRNIHRFVIKAMERGKAKSWADFVGSCSFVFRAGQSTTRRSKRDVSMNVRNFVTERLKQKFLGWKLAGPVAFMIIKWHAINHKSVAATISRLEVTLRHYNEPEL